MAISKSALTHIHLDERPLGLVNRNRRYKTPWTCCSVEGYVGTNPPTCMMCIAVATGVRGLGVIA